MTPSIARLLLILLLLPAPASSADSTVLRGQVLRVVDGDTLDVLLSSGRLRVRLHGVDAPERDQPGGGEATAWLAAQVHDRLVELEPVSQDQYDRLVAIVHLDGINLNRALIGAGQAWAYRRYLRRADRDWCDAEAAARAGRVGLWQADHPAAPWEFRSTRGKGPFTDYTRQRATDCRRTR